MKSVIKDCIRKKVIILTELPNGDYDGVWGGYKVTVTIDDNHILEFTTVVGIRTTYQKCVVHIKDGLVEVETV